MGLSLKSSEQIIKDGDEPFKGSTTPMVDLGTHVSKYFITSKITPEQLFTNAYVEEVYE